MTEERENLLRVLSAFMEDLWLPYEDSLGSISVEIKGGMIDKEVLKQELQTAIDDPDFDWKGLARESQLFMSLEEYKNEEVREHVQNLLTLFIYPELGLTDNQKDTFEQALVNVLKSKETVNDGWMTSSELLELVNRMEPSLNAQSYHLWQLYLDKILYNKLSVERRIKDNKDRFIGYLRYKENQP